MIAREEDRLDHPVPEANAVGGDLPLGQRYPRPDVVARGLGIHYVRSVAVGSHDAHFMQHSVQLHLTHPNKRLARPRFVRAPSLPYDKDLGVRVAAPEREGHCFTMTLPGAHSPHQKVIVIAGKNAIVAIPPRGLFTAMPVGG